MKLQSNYLNPFQPFPEREFDNRGKDRPRSAIENNLSRSVFSALANTDSPAVLAAFLQALVQQHGSSKLQGRMKAFAERITDMSKVEFGLQTWPVHALGLESSKKVLIGISSSHQRTSWTHNQRKAPMNPQPDAWIYVPGQMLLVFEWKNDEHPLDATQMSAYAHLLELLTENDNVHNAAPGKCLDSAEQAEKVREACKDLVLDLPWDVVAKALEDIHGEDRGSWLCRKAAEYVRWHIRPPYEGVQTILAWLNGLDTSDRRYHLRTLVNKMGEELKKSADLPGIGITFAKDRSEKWDLRHGAGSAVFVKLMRGGEFLQRDLLGRKVDAVLWFQFTENESHRIGLEYYIQASGSHTSGQGDLVAAWNIASSRHLACAEPFEEKMKKLIDQVPPNSQMIVSAVSFNGKKQTWQGGGVSTKPESPQVTPQEALEFLRQRHNELWCFPRVEDASEIKEAAAQVRKPAISLLTPLDADELGSCGRDGPALQKCLQDALDIIV